MSHVCYNSDMSKCFFVSDLHLFANRSNGHRYLEEIVQTASRAETFVLGGDIFDFRWAGIPTLRAVERAVHWLVELTGSCPKCHFHLVLGNHDYHQALIDRLMDVEKHIANLSWHRYYVRLGSSVFLHGDVADKEMDARMLAEAREEWLDARRRGPFLSMLYDVVVLTRLHKPFPRLVYAKRIVVRRIFKYLENIGEGPGHGVRDVYFGHTHRKLSNYVYRGLRFHNCGAPIKGVKFRILEAKR
jgi:UDP-2,3-diacylglucosamine pyrophosphatase LpxH